MMKKSPCIAGIWSCEVKVVRKEKRYTRMLLALLFLGLLLLTSCMNDKVKAPEDGNSPEQTADIVVGVERDHAPWFQMDKDSKAAGIYADLFRELSQAGDFTYAFVEVDPAAARPALKAGTIHCYLGTLVPPTGETLGLWQSDVLFASALCLAVPRDSAITEPAGIKGKEAAAVKGTPEERYASNLAGRYKALPVTFPGQRDVFRDVEQGVSAAAASDYACVKEKGEDYRILEVSDSIKNAHCLFTLKYNSQAKKLAKAIKKIKESGKLEEMKSSVPKP